MDKLAIFCFVWISKNNDVNRLVFGHLYDENVVIIKKASDVEHLMLFVLFCVYLLKCSSWNKSSQISIMASERR